LIAEVKALELIKPIDQTNFNHSNKTANTFSPDGNYKLKVTYYSYDGLKNIREISKADDVRTVYLWGYGGTLPIAEIKNVADYTTVANALSLIGLSTEASVHSLTDETTIRTKMEELRSKLPSAMISSYTYDSIKGMLSQTGPDGVTSYFTYDNLGRLSLVKDQDSNIVKQYIYRYKK
jgi:YD repeat-containing protein